MITDKDVYDYLEHVGVKGMRWGVRKGRSEATKEPSRREKRQIKKAERAKANEKKVGDLLNASLKDPEILVNLNGQMIVTGKEFVEHMSNGGAMNVKYTQIYARRQTKEGPYVLEPRGG